MNFSKLAHNWAHQTRKSQTCGNMFFEGETIYSYGSHFVCGKLVTRKGQTVALITTNTYSSSTARHVGEARSAASHLTTFHVPLYASSHYSDKSKKQTPRSQFSSYMPRIRDLLEKAGRASKRRAAYLEDVRNLYNEANEFAEFFGLKSRLTMPADLDAEITAAAAESRRLAREKAAKEIKAAEEALPKWRNREVHSIPHAYELPSVFLRLSSDRTEVETSKGASVPVEHAERAYRIGLRYLAKHEEYRRNGQTVRVGHFAVDSMDVAGHVKIGCHDIEWAEVERLAAEAGWGNEPAPETAPETAPA